MTSIGDTLDVGVKQDFKEMSLIDKQFVMECGKVRIGATKAQHIKKELCGGFMNIRATVTDYKNFKRDLKLYIGLNDAQMVVDNLSDKIKTCTRYNLVFFPFTGVDNQLRSVTIAAGLISKEDVDSYTWLLTCFKKLSEREPSVIVTDQDASMKAAIATIFPSSRHQFCMWHITEKFQAKRCTYGCPFEDNISFGKQEFIFGKVTFTEMEGRWHIDASRKHNPGMFLVDHENPNQTREQITLASEILFHVNAALCSFKNDVDCIRKLHDHIYEYGKEHAPSGCAHCSSSKGDYFWVVLQMPQPADVVVNNPGLSRKKVAVREFEVPEKFPSRNHRNLLDHVVIATS
ncbi:hypothetical protein QQ045_012993 [Rhodiola kirilowii]